MKSIFKTSKNNILFLIFLMFLVILTSSVFQKSYSSYEASSNINLEVQTAIYIFDEDTINFNAEMGSLLPSDEPYIYTFSVSNFNDEKQSDVDIEYELSILTTTNLPLTYELYRNEEYSSGTNIITSTDTAIDENGSWYKNIVINDSYEMNYDVPKTDIYYLVVYYPETYSNTLSYQGQIDSIVVSIKSKQIIG